MTDRQLIRCHPNYLMNVAHAYIVAANPSSKGTEWFGPSGRGVNAWVMKRSRCETDDDLIFYDEADVIVLSYARAITAAYRRWENEVRLAHDQFGATERQITKSVATRALIAVVKWLFKLGVVAGLGGALAAVASRFFPQKVTSVAGVDLLTAVGALAFAVVSIVVGSVWSNRLWSSAAAQLKWCLGTAEEELERSSIEAFDLHWWQFCEAFQAYTGVDYQAEPSFISIMRNKLRARERWNRKLLFRLTSNIRVAIELVRRVKSRRRAARELTP